MKKLFVALVVAALFAPLSFAEEVKKKDSFFAGVGTPTNFAMAIASTEKGENTCYNQGDIGIDKNGLILSCQSGDWQLQAGKGEFYPDGGYVELPNGFAMQWGKSWNNGTPAGEYTVLNRPFKTACMSIVSTADGENTTYADGVNTWGCDKNGFMANLFYFNSDSPYTTQGWYYWTAYGY